MSQYDFSGWATKNDLLCSDGRTIRKDAFKHCDGKEVPLVWNHRHDDPDDVLGHALLENRDDGVYAYCVLNDTDSGNKAKECVRHGDVRSLSIYANHLKQNGRDVMHGDIQELSLVLAGANPGAFIDAVMIHSDDGNDTEKGLILGYDENIMLYHSDEKSQNGDSKDKKEDAEMAEKKENKEKTVQDVFDELTEEQKNVVYALIGQAIEDKNNKGEKEMSHNVFDTEENNQNTLSHSDMQAIIGDGKRYGSLKESFLAHTAEYGIEDVEMLFPEPKEQNTTPEFISRNMDWVQTVMNGVHHSPFSRIKTRFADITEDEARAKGYIKGSLKKEEVFSLLRRSTSPTTVYKKQKMDRDDVVDITDFDVLAWLKGEMRMMLNEELARAYLIGDGRLSSDEDKIDPNCIRPILTDADLFVIRWGVAEGSDASDKAKNFITACIKSRKNYKGSGNPTLFTTEDMLTDMLLLEDTIGHKLYKTEAELATTLRVSRIVTVPVMEGLTVSVSGSDKDVYGIIVNLNDYNVGADKGGAVNMFEDFDIDYNQQKYLIETRCSGSLVKPFSAIVLRENDTTASLEPTLQNAMAPFRS